MRSTCRFMLLIALALGLTAGLALAAPDNTKPVNVTFTAVTTMPDGAQLQPGTYRMELVKDSSATQVAFYQNKKLVCKCPVKLENASEKTNSTRMMFDTAKGDRVLQTIALKGWDQVLVFSGSGGSGAGL